MVSLWLDDDQLMIKWWCDCAKMNTRLSWFHTDNEIPICCHHLINLSWSSHQPYDMGSWPSFFSRALSGGLWGRRWWVRLVNFKSLELLRARHSILRTLGWVGFDCQLSSYTWYRLLQRATMLHSTLLEWNSVLLFHYSSFNQTEMTFFTRSLRTCQLS